MQGKQIGLFLRMAGGCAQDSPPDLLYFLFLASREGLIFRSLGGLFKECVKLRKCAMPRSLVLWSEKTFKRTSSSEQLTL